MSRKVGDILRASELTIETRCAYCGKTFERYGMNEWGYHGYTRRGTVARDIYYCTYKCMRAAEKTKAKHRM